MKTLLLSTFLTLALALSSFGASTKISDYPNTNAPPASALTILAVTNVGSPTNMNISVQQLALAMQNWFTNLAPYVNTNKLVDTNMFAQLNTNTYLGNAGTTNPTKLSLIRPRTGGTNNLATLSTNIGVTIEDVGGSNLTFGVDFNVVASISYLTNTFNAASNYIDASISGITNSFSPTFKPLVTLGYEGVGNSNMVVNMDTNVSGYIAVLTKPTRFQPRGMSSNGPVTVIVIQGTGGFKTFSVDDVVNGGSVLMYTPTALSTNEGYPDVLTFMHGTNATTASLAVTPYRGVIQSGPDTIINNRFVLATKPLYYDANGPTNVLIDFKLGSQFILPVATGPVVALFTNTAYAAGYGQHVRITLGGATTATNYPVTFVWPSGLTAIWYNATNTTIPSNSFLNVKIEGFETNGVNVFTATSSSTGAQPPGPVAGGSLTNYLVGYWKFDLISGGTLWKDSYGGNDLVNHGAANSAAGVGKLTSTAANFVSAENDTASATNTAFNLPNSQTNFTWAGWVALKNTNDYNGILVKRTAGNTTTYQIYYAPGAGLNVYHGGIGNAGNLTDVPSTTYSTANSGTQTNTWLFVAYGSDFANNLIWIRIGNSTTFYNADTIAWTGGGNTGTAPLEFGTTTSSNPEGQYGWLNGYLNGWALWHRQVTTAELDSLWNMGQGKQWPWQ